MVNLCWCGNFHSKPEMPFDQGLSLPPHAVLSVNQVVLLQKVSLTKTHALDELHLALARDPLSRQLWMVVSDQPTTLQTLREYAERFQIQEELLDEKSNGFQLERSEIRCAPALSRLCFVMAVDHAPADGSRTASGRSR